MCIIVMKPAGITLPLARLESMWKRNDDGAGFMYSDGEKLQIYKGYMTFESFKAALKSFLYLAAESMDYGDSESEME